MDQSYLIDPSGEYPVLIDGSPVLMDTRTSGSVLGGGDGSGSGSGDGSQVYEDPNFWAGVSQGLFSTIGGIWDLVDRGQGTGQYGQQNPVYIQQRPDYTPFYIGFGLLAFILIIGIFVLSKK